MAKSRANVYKVLWQSHGGGRFALVRAKSRLDAIEKLGLRSESVTDVVLVKGARRGDIDVR